MGARQIEHEASQDKDIARKSTRAKADGPAPIHSGFTNRTDTSLGAPPTGAPPDASSPLPTDPTRTKQYAIPKASWGMKGGDGQDVDPAAAHRVMAAAKSQPDDFAKSLHTVLPQSTTEET